MHQILIKHLEERFQSFADLAAMIDEVQLREAIDVPKSKSLADHMWCIIGARESYTAALAAGSWSGFNCSLTEVTVGSVRDKLDASAAVFTETVTAIDTWTPQREELLVTLMEHEVMHEGQIIRLWYALGHELPQSVKWA